MAIKGEGITVTYVAWDTGAGDVKTGDAANHSIYLVQDGAAPVAATNTPTEVSSSNTPGLYQITLLDAEVNFNAIRPAGKSTTSGIRLFFSGDIITEQGILPADTTPNTSGGLITLGKGVGQFNTSYGLGDVNFSGTLGSQAGMLANQVKVTGGPLTDNLINGQMIVIVDGTGAEQEQIIIAYAEATGVITVNLPWVTQPASGDDFAVTYRKAASASDIMQNTNVPDFLVPNSYGKAFTIGGVIALNTDLTPLPDMSEPTVPPPMNAPMIDGISWICMIARTKRDETGTLQQIYSIDGSTVIGSAPMTSNNTLVVHGAFT